MQVHRLLGLTALSSRDNTDSAATHDTHIEQEPVDLKRSVDHPVKAGGPEQRDIGAFLSESWDSRDHSIIKIKNFKARHAVR